MNLTQKNVIVRTPWSLLAMLLFAIQVQVQGQGIILDNPIRAGELTLFRSIEDEHIYLYLLDQARLATDEEGTPQFSFLRYVQNAPGSGKDISTEGTGGGIVHALVTLEVTEDQITEAERALRRIDGQGKIQGPALFTQGRFGLISSFADTDGNLSTQLLGIGAAPILDGQKAAISLQLTKLGAKILWESFKTAAPDISFSFEMELEGYRLPKRAIIEANFDQIYDHKAFAAGIATPYIGAEIKAAFDEITRNGGITVTQIGDDAQLNQLVNTAYNKITEMMFEPMNGSGTPSLSDITSMAGSNSSPLDKANTMLASNRRAFSGNNRRRARRANRQERRQERNEAEEEGEEEEPETEEGEGEEEEGEEEEPEAEEGEGEAEEGEGEEEEPPAEDSEEEEEDETGEEDEEDNDRDDGGSGSANIAIVATFEMKKVKQTGNFKLNLNKYTSDKLVMRFDENIGNLTRLMGNKNHFHQVNLDDDFFRQREISTFLDGYNADDFGKYINFVTVRMQKKHAEGAITDQEIRIDRNNFNDKGNYFKMVYGWKDDNDRRKWMQYQYEVLWSFFGGQEVLVDAKTTSFSAINLKPPYERRALTLEADPEFLKDQGVRSITVTIFYKVGEAEQQKKTTMNVYRNQLSQNIEFLLPENVYEYDYEIQWRLRGNKVISSGRQSSGESILFVDEVPEEQ